MERKVPCGLCRQGGMDDQMRSIMSVKLDNQQHIFQCCSTGKGCVCTRVCVHVCVCLEPRPSSRLGREQPAEEPVGPQTGEPIRTGPSWSHGRAAGADHDVFYSNNPDEHANRVNVKKVCK